MGLCLLECFGYPNTVGDRILPLSGLPQGVGRAPCVGCAVTAHRGPGLGAEGRRVRGEGSLEAPRHGEGSPMLCLPPAALDPLSGEPRLGPTPHSGIHNEGAALGARREGHKLYCGREDRGRGIQPHNNRDTMKGSRRETPKKAMDEGHGGAPRRRGPKRRSKRRQVRGVRIPPRVGPHHHPESGGGHSAIQNEGRAPARVG